MNEVVLPPVPPPFHPPEDDEGWLRPKLVAARWEIFLVIAITIGPFAARSCYMALQGSSSHYMNLLLNDSRLINTTALEAGILGGLLVFLRMRGWIPGDFRIKPCWSGTGQGLLLFLAVAVGNWATVTTLYVINFALQSKYTTFLSYLIATSPLPAPHSVQIGWTYLFVAMIVNAYFEEMTCMGYAFDQFAAKLRPGIALAITVVLRMSCHTYQGWIHMLGIGVVFLIFGLWYIRTRNLWPLIVAHAVLDIFSTVILKLKFG